MVGADPVGAAVQARGQVADHPQVPSAVGVVDGIGAYVEPGPHLADSPLQQALGGHPVHEARQRRLGRGEPDGRLEQEEPDQRLQGDPPVVRRSPGAVSLRASAAWATGPSTSATAS